MGNDFGRILLIGRILEKALLELIKKCTTIIDLLRMNCLDLSQGYESVCRIITLIADHNRYVAEATKKLRSIKTSSSSNNYFEDKYAKIHKDAQD